MNPEINQERWIFKDPQIEDKAIAKVKLLEFRKEGLPFILEDMPKDKQISYVLSYWNCEVLSDDGYYPKGYIKVFPVRIVKSVGEIRGVMDETYNEDITEEEYLKQYEEVKIDKFLEIDGEQIF